MKKQTEGNEEQRRAAARDARAQGTSPSAEGATLGASKQRKHDTDPQHPKQKTTHPIRH
jgi:hypothetical protein